MSGNSFGDFLRLSTFGESHGEVVGGVLDGLPGNIELDFDAIQKQLYRRKPGQSAISTGRKESDQVQFLSGLMGNKTTGAPVAFILKNEDARSKDYNSLKEVYRPGHADYTYQTKFGIRDHRGGGRSSARTTAPWVAAGAIAEQLLPNGIQILAFVSSIGQHKLSSDFFPKDRQEVDATAVRIPDQNVSEKVEQSILQAKEEGDSLGGIITCIVRNMPVGWGEPQFDKLSAALGHAMLSINAVKGVEFGDGFAASQKKGSETNDEFAMDGKEVKTRTNHSGGLLGGISNGEDLVFRIAFKPTSTIKKEQQTVNQAGEEVTLSAEGRHDPCVVPRAVPIVESMTALVLADQYFKFKARL